MFSVTLEHYLVVSSTLFVLGALGLFINVRNLIRMLLCIELMLLAATLNFIIFSYIWQSITGYVFALFMIAVAATESALGLAIIVLYFRARETVDFSQDPLLRG